MMDFGAASVDVHDRRIPAASPAAAAYSPAPILPPSGGFTRRTLMRPSAHATVKPSASTATISPILPAIPLGSRAGSGFASNTWRFLPSKVVHAPGAGL